MSFRFAPRLALLLALGLSGCGGGGGVGGAAGTPEDVTLLRDVFGVPHIFADSDRGALYGLGWASAEDRLFQMLWSRLMAQGRVAEYFGPGFVAGSGETHVDRTARTGT